jgi:hypothetical protein
MMNSHDFGQLLDGEKIVWSGQPRQVLLLMPRDSYLIPFSLLWGGFAVFWEIDVLRSNAPLPFALFGVPFVLVGIYLILGRFLVDAWMRRRIHNAITNRRILIARSGMFSNFVALGLDKLPSARLSESSNGRGMIQFGESIPFGAQRNFGSWIPSMDPTPQSIGIEDARNVFDKIQRLVPRTG